MTDLCRLTIAAPADLEDDIVEMLLRIEPPLGGFSVIQTEGHGLDFEHAHIAERVRGRTARVMVQIVIARARVDGVLERLSTTAARTQTAWWVEPVERFGRLG